MEAYAYSYAMPILRFCYSYLTLFLPLRLRPEKIWEGKVEAGCICQLDYQKSYFEFIVRTFSVLLKSLSKWRRLP